VASAIERFERGARAAGLAVEIRRFPEGTRTAADAARAVGCGVAQIVKSLVFVADGEPVVALTSGANRVDPERLAAALGAREVRRATPEEARAATGFAIGGTPPLGYPRPVRMLIDEDLLGLPEVWAAAGTPDAVFRTTPAELLRATGAVPASFAVR
jgi:prolyl-tRNA editing enzyme YbaK/EbsC (Cys-tRNA(Pro) deacylase)